MVAGSGRPLIDAFRLDPVYAVIAKLRQRWLTLGPEPQAL